MFFKLFFLCLTLVCVTYPQQNNKKSWDYIILGISTNSSNEDMIKWELQIVRIDRGRFGISGKLIINTEINDEYYVEARTYRSAMGNNNYQLLPLKVAKQTLNHFMATSYEKVVMRSVANCSNFPQSIDGKPPFLEKKVYIAELCSLSLEDLPSYMPAGFFKILYLGSGPVNYAMEVLVKIETD